jgi:polyisoprenoid-binding protein YceI
MMKTVIGIFLFAGAFALDAATLDSMKGETHFLAVGRPSALKIDGTGRGPSGDLRFTKTPEGVSFSGEISVDLSTLDTGIGTRDRHMKEKYLEVEKYKSAVLKFTDARIPKAAVTSGGEVKLTATLNLHGQEKPVDVDMTVKPQGEKILSSSKFSFKLSQFAIDIPKFSGITVADDVEVTVSTEVASKEVL